ncbi:MAG: hypothetical protein HUJ16_00865 [Kangiella sp.]|nr:hypothetical protein [Kangiella sp.]
MKKRSREINIFSMSALDLFASAMGAFVIVAVIMFPYFPNTGDSPERVAEVRAELEAEIDSLTAQVASLTGQVAELEAQLAACEARSQQQEAALNQCMQEQRQAEARAQQVQAELQRTQQELERCQGNLNNASQQLQSCRAALDRTYLVVAISWAASGDDVDLHVVDPLGNEYYYAARTFGGSPAALEEDNVNGPGNEIWQHPEAVPGEYRVYYRYYARRSGPAEVRGFLLHKDGRQVLPSRTLYNEGEKPLVATIVVDRNGYVRIR